MIFSLKKHEFELKRKFPKVDCESVFEIYGNSTEKKMTYAYFEK